MKKLFLLSIGLCGAILIQANINFALDYSIFKTDNNQQYVEFYLSVNGNSVYYAETSPNLFQSKIEITYLIENGEEVINFKKFIINSPEYSMDAVKLDILDLKRLNFPVGDYTYTILAKDLISKSEAKVTEKIRVLPSTASKMQFSEIQLANQFTTNTGNGDFIKNGYDIVPSVSHVYDDAKKNLIGYFEIYFANKSLKLNEQYLLDMRIEDAISSKVVANLRAIKRMKANIVSPIIQQFDLSDLPSGNYNLVVEAKDRNNKTITSQTSNFYRINSNLNNIKELIVEGSFVDTMRNAALLAEYIKALRPISYEKEKEWADNQSRYADLDLMQKYFLNFWKERNAVEPQFAWFEYKRKLDFINQEFGYGGVSGYNTERGRVYLQYGAPNAVNDVKYDSDNVPYSIWQYNKLNGLTNRRIVFYSPTLEMMGYEVIHSNIPGEVQNEDWEYSISTKSLSPRQIKERQDDPNYNDRAKDLFNNPR